MKTIQIDHIGKTEGHLSFVGALVNGDFSEARIITEEGARLIEGILLGRKYYEAPVITARICGICPIVHNLTAIKALEQALNIKVSEEIVIWRRILLAAQWIHSHALHAFFLSFPDLIGISNNFDLVGKYPVESQLALQVRDWAVEIAAVVGGRTVHPINSVVGGFKVFPDENEWLKLMAQQPIILQKAIKLFAFVKKQQWPIFVNPTNYVSLRGGGYADYDGEIYFSDNQTTAPAAEILTLMTEWVLPHEKVKRVQYLNRSLLVGALARINNNFDQLNQEAKRSWQSLKLSTPCYNSFYNTLAQLAEIVQAIEEIKKLACQYEKLAARRKVRSLRVSFKENPGRGVAAMEAPRGLLFHEYELDKAGNILHCNIVTPTAIFLANLEDDLKKFLVENKKLSARRVAQLVRTLIRAYDPCISCATH